MSNEQNNQATAATPIKGEMVSVNGIQVEIKRTETERVKEGKEATVYYTVELDQFTVATKDKDGKPVMADGKVKPDIGATLTTIAAVLGFDTLIDKLQAKLNQDCRGAQMDAGKDSYSMDEKRKLILAYVNNGFGASRMQRKSPIELAQADCAEAMAALKKQLEAKTITQEQFVAQATEARNKLLARVMELTAIPGM